MWVVNLVTFGQVGTEEGYEQVIIKVKTNSILEDKTKFHRREVTKCPKPSVGPECFPYI